jgi:uncharacterized repeat protein (TIGR03806 family)
MRVLLPALALFFAAIATAQSERSVSDAAVNGAANPASLSAFGFFNGSADKASPLLIPYRLRTPLFSDYAEKQRFIYLPVGEGIDIDPSGKLSFPLGSALIKSFGYADPSGHLKIIETRVLLHRAEGWVALPYVWRADGSDADLRVGGSRVPVHFVKPDGAALDINYGVPNKNQCKQCHSSDGAIMPIGPVWQNMEFIQPGDRNRIARDHSEWIKSPFEAQWNDAKSGSLEQRAHAYLRVNCGHCHAPKGSASNSGLFLDGSAADVTAYGIGKRPVAAGRASGDMDFVIEPGHPERSILINRMKSTDSGIAMPELGRSSVHAEGVALLEQWIKEMKPQ